MEKSQLKEQLAADLKTALKDKNTRRISILRLLLAEIKNKEIDKRSELADSDVMKIISGAAKKHEDSIAQFEQGNRPDLVTQEREELDIIKTYLPKQLSDEEISKLVDEAVAESGASSSADFGKAMKVLMPKIAGRASGQIVSEKLKSKLG